MGTPVVTHLLWEKQERLVSSFVQRILEGSDLGALRQTNAQELRGLVRKIVTSLSDYLEGDEGEVTKCFDLVGDTCFRLSISLIETVYALYFLRWSPSWLWFCGRTTTTVIEPSVANCNED